MKLPFLPLKNAPKFWQLIWGRIRRLLLSPYFLLGATGTTGRLIIVHDRFRIFWSGKWSVSTPFFGDVCDDHSRSAYLNWGGRGRRRSRRKGDTLISPPPWWQSSITDATPITFTEEAIFRKVISMKESNVIDHVQILFSSFLKNIYMYIYI